jgi:hypothetical protein
MFRKLSILALAALFSVVMSAEATERELPVSKAGYNKNAKRTKYFEACTSEGKPLSP